MARSIGAVIFFTYLLLLLSGTVLSEPDIQKPQTIQTAPHRDLEKRIRDGTVTTELKDYMNVNKGAGETAGRVSVTTVAWLTLAMAAATGLGAIPFFFVELEAQWAGVCNGLAAGVMLAASFDLVQEGQEHGSGSWVVIGILSGGIFIWLCKKFLEQYGEVSMLDIKGAEASKAILVVGIMTLHSFGEGSGVGVSFAGSKGLQQGLLVTLAIAVHNIPEGLAVSMVLASRGVSPQNAMIWSFITSLPQPIVAVPSFLCADAFNKVLPFCTGFAAGCMIWMVIAEVLPDAFKEANPSHVASAGTIAVAFMEALSTVLLGFSNGFTSEDASGFAISLLFGLGPLLGGTILVLFANAFSLPQPLLTGIASGIALKLAAWRPSQLLISSKISFFPLLLILLLGAATYHIITTTLLNLVQRKKSSAHSHLSSPSSLSISALTLQSFLACGGVFLHGFAEGLALGVAAPKAYGLGRHMVLPVSLHGLPRGAAVASCVLGATDSWRWALAAATLTGFAGPTAAIGAILTGIGYNGLDYWMVFACGLLLPGFARVFRRALKLDMKKGIYGLLMGFGFASVCLMSTRLVCLHTPYCNSAPEAVT
ncbi:Zinc transporter ZupT [Rhynchospora pubera]|uniref:Zinc transporter ZupT n=1 Tax=Rhynchospora pubera TaxID=906938 RepID=A0AAV8F592_9POAL|nr:Zinc transporter ZupT [Rhynchospora pubera]KAJ4804575.1 Zinc transporter ZupT [Rhynchospora pubera]